MKRIIFIGACFALTYNNLQAQEPADALRFSWTTSNGTARQQAIGGAGGSLGGEISTAFVNPAGIGFYKTGDFVLTPGYDFNRYNSTYFGRKEQDRKNGFALGTTGFVMGFPEKNKDKQKSSAFALLVNRTASFNSNILYRGANTQSSYSQKFLEELDNNNDLDPNSVAQNYPFGSSLAFNTYWIDTANGWTAGNKQFVSLATPLLAGDGLLQEQKITNRGGITELALAGAVNLNEKLYLGGTFSVPYLFYKKESTFTEADATADENGFDFATFSEYLKTSGFGLNLRLGVIYKPVERVRLGFAVHTPTLYTLTDKYNASVTTNTEGYQDQWSQSSTLFTDGQDAEFKYRLFTPYRLIASASYVLREVEDVRKQKGFLTADIEFVNYKASSFKTLKDYDDSPSTRDYLSSLNDAIDRAYKGALNVRVGGELKFTTIMVRLGGAYYGNPYKDLAGENGHRFQLTGGLGYRDKGFFIDLAYVHTMGKDIHFPYRLQNAAFSGATVKTIGGNAVMTIGFKI